MSRSGKSAFAAVMVVLGLGLSRIALAGDPEALTPPKGKINVAFLISDDAVVIDFAGPWAVFEAMRGDRFDLYTVAQTKQPIRASSGMRIVPDYTLDRAPPPNVIVIPAQRDHSDAILRWLRQQATRADVIMSVCSGAFILAETGLLDGKDATVYHNAFDRFSMSFPKVRLRRGARFVEQGRLATSGGLSSGIDLALRVVERYFGRDAATQTAYDLEYQGKGWLDAASNSVYASAPAGPVDPVCGMTVDPAHSYSSIHGGKTYYFCASGEKKEFDAHPERYVH